MAGTSMCLIFGFVSSMISLILIGVSIASSQWLIIRTHVLKMDIGLVRHCNVDSDYCGDMENLHDLVSSSYLTVYQAIQAFYLLHTVGALISTSLYILYTVQFFESKSSFKLVTAFNFVTLAFGTVTVAIFAVNCRKFFHLESSSSMMSDDELVVFGHAFYTSIAGLAFTFIVMILSAMEATHAAALINNMRSRFTVWTTPYSLFVQQDV